MACKNGKVFPCPVSCSAAMIERHGEKGSSTLAKYEPKVGRCDEQKLLGKISAKNKEKGQIIKTVPLGSSLNDANVLAGISRSLYSFCRAII
jgi:hypothetical protein